MADKVLKEMNPENCPIEPIADYLVVKRLVVKETSGGILLPEDMAKGRGRVGVQGDVIAAGPGVLDEEGKLIEKNPCDPGDRVFFTGQAGLDLEEAFKLEFGTDWDVKGLLMIRGKDVIGKVKKVTDKVGKAKKA
jgi:co-chaperonin GroES (HSP10)